MNKWQKLRDSVQSLHVPFSTPKCSVAGELIAQTRFQLKDVSFWSDESHWEATVVAYGGNDTGEVIGTVKQNISSFDSKWFLGFEK